jgi:hypothetical protein
MANSWVRLWHDMPNDPKWRVIAHASSQSIATVQAVYLQLLVDASRNVTRGHVTVTHEEIAFAIDVTEQVVDAVMLAMEGRVISCGVLTGWEARNPLREDDGDPLTGAKSAAQRKRDQRERERLQREFEGENEALSHDVTTVTKVSRNVTTDKDKEEIKKKPMRGKRAGDVLEIPGWLPRTEWDAYLEIRRSKKNVVETEHALKGIISQLEKFKAEGHDPVAILNTSIQNSWTGVFPPKGNPANPLPFRPTTLAEKMARQVAQA